MKQFFKKMVKEINKHHYNVPPFYQFLEQFVKEFQYTKEDLINLANVYVNNVYAGIEESVVLLYQTENFVDSENGLATIEKAFVDLYYAVTRNEYPLALQELVRIYENLVRLGNIDKKIMISVAAKRSIQYDIRFIAESKFITKQALKFVEILGKDV